MGGYKMKDASYMFWNILAFLLEIVLVSCHSTGFWSGVNNLLLINSGVLLVCMLTMDRSPDSEPPILFPMLLVSYMGILFFAIRSFDHISEYIDNKFSK